MNTKQRKKAQANEVIIRKALTEAFFKHYSGVEGVKRLCRTRLK